MGDWDDVLEKCIEGSERPILLIYEELKNKEEEHDALNKHYLNDLIGSAQWKDMFRRAREKDEDLR